MGYWCQHMRYGDEEEEQPKLASLLSSQNMERISTYATTKYRDSQEVWIKNPKNYKVRRAGGARVDWISPWLVLTKRQDMEKATWTIATNAAI